MQPIRGALALTVLLLQLLFLAAGAQQACPMIGNFITAVTPIPAPPVNGEPQEPLLLLTTILVDKIDPSACECKVEEDILGSFKPKATVKRCFGVFTVSVNKGMHRVSIVCKKRGCPKVMETRIVDAQGIDCGHPGDIDNGNVDFPSTTAGAAASYSCDDGYQLQPFSGYFRICTPFGSWTGEVPTCAVDCGPPPEIANGTLVGGTSTTVGKTAFYYCNFGATLVGSSTITCQDDGTWEDPPMCVLANIDCGHPGDINNGNVNFTTTTLGATARYSCDDGYQLQPSSEHIRLCTQSGNWSGEVPTCAVDCGPAPKVANGILLGGILTTVGNTAFYFCNFGATLMGNSTITCQDDGTWEDPPMCVLPMTNCGPPPQIANATVRHFRLIGQTTAVYVCNFGYILEGKHSISCLHDNGMWGQAPTCKPVQ